jgi:hypothetical protein
VTDRTSDWQTAAFIDTRQAERFFLNRFARLGDQHPFRQRGDVNTSTSAETVNSSRKSADRRAAVVRKMARYAISSRSAHPAFNM